MTWGELCGELERRGLLGGAPGSGVPPSMVVTGVAYDSRRVERGHVFVALHGLRADGADFARQALDRGAVAVVSERPAPPDIAPWVTVGDARLALAILASTFYGRPSADMQVVGITGTNGKTTTAYLVASIFDAAGVRCGIDRSGTEGGTLRNRQLRNLESLCE